MSTRNKKILDWIFRPTTLLIVSTVVGILAAITGGWNFIEPVLGFATLALAGATWWQTRRAKEAVYTDNGDGSWVIGLQVGRPVSEAVKKQFGQLDCLIDVKEVVGDHTLALPEHYEAVARAVYAAVAAGQGKNVHLVLSGPVALSFLIGQCVGLFHFQITVYQFAPSSGSYEPMPRPTRAWLEHR